MKVIGYSETHALRWDAFVARAAQGTFLHTRRFLGYHGDRFRDCSLLVEDTGGELIGLLPAAQSLTDLSQVVSHPGITYGGLLHLPRCAPSEVRSMLVAAAEHLNSLGFGSLIYKSVPLPVHRSWAQADLHALFLQGAKLIRRDLWNAIALQAQRHASAGHLRDARKAARLGLRAEPAHGDSEYGAFHQMLTETLASRHGIAPVHSLDEMLVIARLFPHQVELWQCRAQDGSLLAGIWLFRLHDMCWHVQYIAASENGRKTFATDLLLATIVNRASEENVGFLTLGASTQNAGKDVNDSLFSFKSGIGAGSVAHDFYELHLE
jgi:hypothetical protein